MVLELQHGLKNQQQLSMTPQLQQAIKILQLSSLDLQEFIAQQVIENPMLASQEDEQEYDCSELENSKHKDSTVSSNDYNFYDTPKKQSTTHNFFGEQEQGSYENFLCYETTLNNFLESQLSSVDLSFMEKKIALLLIDSIDERGYLGCKTETIAKQEDLSEEDVEKVLRIIQNFEPTGVGARTLSECMQIQIKAYKLENGIIEKIVKNHLNLAAKNQKNILAKALKIDKETVEKNLEILTRLNFSPGSSFSKKRTDYITPDLSIRQYEGQWQVFLEKGHSKSVHLNPLYQNISLSSLSKSDKIFFKEKTKEASWLIKSLEQRDRTLLKVMTAIVKYQEDFFNLGPQYLKPLVLKDIALETDLHESTISRCTANKFVNTPRGTLELKFFFLSKLRSNIGLDVANETIKFELKNIIKEEDKKKPLTDQKIAEFFTKKGIKISRRTITKYREQLGILPSPKRRELR